MRAVALTTRLLGCFLLLKARWLSSCISMQDNLTGLNSSRDKQCGGKITYNLPSSRKDVTAAATAGLAAGLRRTFVTALVDSDLVVNTDTPLQVLSLHGGVQEQVKLLGTLTDRLLGEVTNDVAVREFRDITALHAILLHETVAQ